MSPVGKLRFCPPVERELVRKHRGKCLKLMKIQLLRILQARKNQGAKVAFAYCREENSLFE